MVLDQSNFTIFYRSITIQIATLGLLLYELFFLNTDYKPPSKLAMDMVLAYDNLVCNGIDVAKDNMVYQQVSNAVTSSVNAIKCVKDKACAVKQSKVCNWEAWLACG